MNSKKPEELGTVYDVQALCFDKNKNIIGTCMDTPNAIAKACMEHSEIGYIKQFGERSLRPVGFFYDRMKDWNTANSIFKYIGEVGRLSGRS